MTRVKHKRLIKIGPFNVGQVVEEGDTVEEIVEGLAEVVEFTIRTSPYVRDEVEKWVERWDGKGTN